MVGTRRTVKKRAETLIATQPRRASCSLPAFNYAGFLSFGFLFVLRKVGPKPWYGMWLTRPVTHVATVYLVFLCLLFSSLSPSVPPMQTLLRGRFGHSTVPISFTSNAFPGSVSLGILSQGYLNFVDDTKVSKMRGLSRSTSRQLL